MHESWHTYKCAMSHIHTHMKGPSSAEFTGFHVRCKTTAARLHEVSCSVLLCVAARCSVLQCVAVCCSVMQCDAVCCSVLQCVAVCYGVYAAECVAAGCSVLLRVCCTVLLCRGGVCAGQIQRFGLIGWLQRVAECVLQCVVKCVSQCVA